MPQLSEVARALPGVNMQVEAVVSVDESIEVFKKAAQK